MIKNKILKTPVIMAFKRRVVGAFIKRMGVSYYRSVCKFMRMLV